MQRNGRKDISLFKLYVFLSRLNKKPVSGMIKKFIER
jgi:hypothetical protein